jgi:hypothetical protein
MSQKEMPILFCVERKLLFYWQTYGQINLKNTVVWDVTVSNTFPRWRYFFYLKMETTRSSETSVYNKPIRRQIP